MAAVGTAIGSALVAAGSLRDASADTHAVSGDTTLGVAWRKTVLGRDKQVETSTGFPLPKGDATSPVCHLSAFEPGDRYRLEFVLWLEAEPAVLSLTSSVVAPPRGWPLSAASGSHGLGASNATVSYLGQRREDDGSATTTAAYTASLASLLWLGGVGPGLRLDGTGTATAEDIVLGRVTPAPFESEVAHGIAVDWVVPTNFDRSVPTPEYSFAFGFDTEQRQLTG
jgi:hypothetical protein